MAHDAIKKRSLLANYKYVWLDMSSKNWQLIVDEEELRRLQAEDQLGSGDVIIELTAEFVRVAELKNFIELK